MKVKIGKDGAYYDTAYPSPRETKRFVCTIGAEGCEEEIDVDAIGPTHARKIGEEVCRQDYCGCKVTAVDGPKFGLYM